MKTTVHRLANLSLKVLVGLVVLACLVAGLAGLLLPIIPGLLFLALAGLIAARHFPAAERWARGNPAVGRYVDGARRYSFSRISLSRLTLGQRVRFGVLLGAKALVDGCALIAGAVTTLVRRGSAVLGAGSRSGA